MAAGWHWPNTSVALSAAATKSLILLAPGANVGFVLVEICVSFDQAAAAAGIRCELYRVTTLGSPAGTTAAPTKRSEQQADTVQASGLYNLSAEPTAVEVIGGPWYVSPATGLLLKQYPLGREDAAKAGGARIGLRAVTPTGVTPNAVAYIDTEE